MMFNKSFQTRLLSLALLAFPCVHGLAEDLDLINYRAESAIYPNIMLTIDDSLSMDFAWITDEHPMRIIQLYYNGVDGKFSRKWLDWRHHVAEVNLIFYDTNRVYEPWPGYTDAPIEETWQTYGNFQVNLWKDTAGSKENSANRIVHQNNSDGLIDIWDDYYQAQINADGSYTITDVSFSVDQSKTCEYMIDEDDNPETDKIPDQTLYEQCVFGKRTRPNTSKSITDFINGPVQDELQNIANWMKYHSTRLLSLKLMVSSLVDKYPNFYFGLDHLNDFSRFIPIRDKSEPIEEYNQSIIERIYELRTKANTPLRRSMARIGDYFQNGLTQNGVTYDRPITQACQLNYNVLITDGEELAPDPIHQPIRSFGDLDGDGQSNTKADIAYYFYNTDLAPSLENIVPDLEQLCPSIDAVNHQHLSYITVGFGTINRLEADENECWPKVNPGVSGSWGDNSTDDLWHAAYNSRGVFTKESAPQILFDKLDSMFKGMKNTIVYNRNSILNSYQFNTDTGIYYSSARLDKNTGDLILLQPEFGGNGNGNSDIRFMPSWSAAAKLDEKIAAHQNRNIFTYDRYQQQANKKGVKILNTPGNLLNNLSQNMKDKLGDDFNGFAQKIHSAPLGPILNSEITYVGKQVLSENKQSYADNQVIDSKYLDYVKNRNTKDPVVFVGSFDNMLHAFDAKTGEELFAYIPGSLVKEGIFSGEVDKPGFGVDGKHFVADVYIEGRGGWRTVFIGGTRRGGQSIYALDITSPETFSPDDILWEFSDQSPKIILQNSKEMGFSYGRASVGRFENGKTYVVFGNGYNNTQAFDGDAHQSQEGVGALHVLDVATGQFVNEFQSAQGRANDPKGLNRPNGFAEPALVDSDSNGLIDTIYVGDFYGNLYSINAKGDNALFWWAYGNNGPFWNRNMDPFFSGRDIGNAPITTKPVVTKTQVKIGEKVVDSNLVIFGTGQEITRSIENSTEYLVGIVHNMDRETRDGETSDEETSDEETRDGETRDRETRDGETRDRETVLPKKSKMTEQKISFANGNILYEGENISSDADFEDSRYNDQGWFIKFDGALSAYSVVRDLNIIGGELHVILDRKPKQTESSCYQEESASLLLVINPRTGGASNGNIFLDENHKNKKVNDKLVIGEENNLNSAAQQVVIGDDGTTYTMYINEGEVILKERGAINASDGRQNWRRLY